MGVRPLPVVVTKRFTAKDVVSRWDVVEAHIRASSAAATGYIHTVLVLARMPFPIRAIQVYGGSEFKADVDFEEECQSLG
jgi:putative transposase